jgi:hypothetical protein
MTPSTRCLRALVSVLMLPLIAGAIAAMAGTVEVVLRDENGAPLAGESVAVHPPLPEGQIFWPSNQDRVWRGVTDRKGVVVISGLPPGPYTATLSLRTPGIVPPQDNPLAPVPTVTLATALGRVRLEIEAWHGAPVVSRVAVHRGDIEVVRVRAREIDHGFPLQRGIRVDKDDERILAPGRWDLTLDPPAGYLLIDLEIDGRSVEGHVASVETEPFGAARFVTWHITAPAAIVGRVTFDGPRTAATVVARLIEPGPWIEAVSRRGGSVYRVVQAGPDLQDDYELELPDGLWEVGIGGDGVVSADPARVELAVPAGGEVRQDFRVQTEDEDEGGMLVVEVLDPEGGEVAGATVEVWHEDVTMRGDEPLARETTERYLPTVIRGLPAGNYVIAAGHPRYAEGRAGLEEFDPDQKKTAHRIVTLRQAATLHAVTADGDGEPVEGIPLLLSRTGPMPEMMITEPRLAVAAASARGATDATGHAWIEGIWPGAYELTTDPEVSGDPGRFVRFVDGDQPVESLELFFAGADEQGAEITVLPAASFEVRLQCAGDLPLPGAASAAVLRAPADEDRIEGGRWMERSVLRLDDVPLVGRIRDTLVVGPLEADAYHVAIRPTGHQRWTWAMGTERFVDAAMLTAGPGEPTRLGTLEIDCGPAIRLEPRSGDGNPLPPLESIARRREGVTLTGTVIHQGRSISVAKAAVDAHPDALVIRELPEGEAELEIGLSHPCFVPPVVRVPLRAELQRGKTEQLAPLIPVIGGVIHLEGETGCGARLTHPGGKQDRRQVETGRIAFENLLPGIYHLELCADASCEVVLRSWDRVEVAPMATVKLP